ncbi:MAG: hypothetical protein PUC61_06235 [Bacteroidales bacterium]|nr:hypothetical protein [Bacteroidales bacterium]
MKYFVEVREIHTGFVMVEADSVKEAERKAVGEFMAEDDYLPGDMVIECTVDLDESEES